MKEINVSTSRRTEMVALASRVQDALADLGVREGLVTVYVPHTTAAVTLNEGADPDVASDIERALDRLVPWSGGYAHAEGNSAAHVKASLVGSSVRVPVQRGRLRLGTWQEIYFCEFDGPRERCVWILPG